MRERDIERFLAKSAPDGDCWRWTGSTNKKGYGRFLLDGSMTTAQRAAWVLFVGPVPAGFTVDHLCRNRACVRLTHLEVVPHRVNLLRGKTITAAQAARTHCPAGHAYDAIRDGKRKCRACDRERSRRRYHEGKAVAP